MKALLKNNLPSQYIWRKKKHYKRSTAWRYNPDQRRKCDTWQLVSEPVKYELLLNDEMILWMMKMQVYYSISRIILSKLYY